MSQLHGRTVLAPALQNAGSPLPRRGFLARLGAVFTGGALAGTGLLALPRRAQAATAGAEPFIGEIMMFAGNFPPRDWAFCDGQLLPIAQNTALFSILGTTYGGDGRVTFGLPDLRGRFPLHPGQGPGLPNYILGEQGGNHVQTLTVNQMPAHSHPANAQVGNGTSDMPTGMLPARDPAGAPRYGPSANGVMAASAIGNTGGSQPVAMMPPYLGISFCICLFGIFPPRN